MISSVVNEEGRPVEIAPGRGNLRYGSSPANMELARGVSLVEHHVSFSRIVATQPMIAGVIGWFMRQQRRVPLYTYRSVEGDSSMKLQPREHPLAAAIDTPWPRAGTVQLVGTVLGSFLTHGNSVTPVEQGARNAIRFDPTDWRYLNPILPWRGSVEGWEVNTDTPEERRVVASEGVLHVADWSPLGPFGLSPLQQLGITIAIEDAAQRHQRNQLANGVRTASAIKTTDERFFGLDPEERKELMENFRQEITSIMAGPANSGRPWMLPPGLDVTPFGQNAQEAQLLEQRHINRGEALAVYGLPPSTQGEVARGAELTEQRAMAVLDGLVPPLLLIEACINAQIAKGLLGEPDVFVAFDWTGILRGDKLKEIQALREAIGSALLTPNEGRDQLQKPRSNDPSMDAWYLPRNNLIPVDVPYQPNGQMVGGDAPASSDEGADAPPAAPLEGE